MVWMFTVIGLFKVLSLKLGSDAGWIGASWLFRMYPFFFIGTLVKREDLFKRIFDGGRKCFDLMGVAYIVFLVLVMTLFAGRLSLEDAAAPFAIYVIVWLFYQYRQQESIAKKILQNMGRQSLAIYLFHYFLLQSVDYSIFNPSFRAHNPLWLTLVAIFTAFVICQLCICLSWLVRQNRVLSFLCLGMW